MADLAPTRRKRLRRSNPGSSGYTRVLDDDGFAYLDLDGAPISDPEVLARIRALAIPPAWKDVWICPDPLGHLQATGVDAAGRRQYLYHELWREHRSHLKFEHVVRFAHTLPTMREGVLATMGGGRRPRPRPSPRVLDPAARRRHVPGRQRRLREGGRTSRPRHDRPDERLDQPGRGRVRLHRQRGCPPSPRGPRPIERGDRDGVEASPRWRDTPPRVSRGWRLAPGSCAPDQRAPEGPDRRFVQRQGLSDLERDRPRGGVRGDEGEHGAHRASAAAGAHRGGERRRGGAGQHAGGRAVLHIDPRVFDRYRSGWTIASELEAIDGRGLDEDQRREEIERAVLDLLAST